MGAAGREVHGVLNNADASSGVEVPFYTAAGNSSGGQTADALGAGEFLAITDILVVTVPGGDVHVFLNADNDGTPDTGETVVRGTLAANAGIAKSFIATARHGAAGARLFVVAPAGAVDVNFTGRVQRT